MLLRAHATLADGCVFIENHAADRPMRDTGWAPVAHSRMIGNRLRELDLFLSVLIEEVALVLAPPGHDAKAFARLRNTPNKLRLVQDCAGFRSDELPRLRAIGRLTACLHHCAGKVHAVSIRHDVLLAAGETARRRTRPPPNRLFLEPQTIRAICTFYRRTGDSLLAMARHGAPDLDFSVLCADIEEAIVACDGI